MNKVILMGRLTRDAEVRYSKAAEPIAVVRFSVAVNRRFKREGEAEADFINCVAFGKTGEFINTYFKKGSMISVVGRIQTGSYEKDGKKVYTTDVVVEEAYFAGSKLESAERGESKTDNKSGSSSEEFYTVEDNVDDDDLPF